MLSRYFNVTDRRTDRRLVVAIARDATQSGNKMKRYEQKIHSWHRVSF